MPFDGALPATEDPPVARSKTITRKLTEHELARVVQRLQRHERPEVRHAVEHAIDKVLNDTLQAKHPINQPPTRVIWCITYGASLLANDMVTLDYAVEIALAKLADMQPKLPKLPPRTAVERVIQTLLRKGAGRPKGPKVGTRTAAIAALFKACGLPQMTEEAVGKLLRRHASIDLTIIGPNSTG